MYQVHRPPKYKYPGCKYKYLKFVLEYYSTTSTSTKYYITDNNSNQSKHNSTQK